MEVQGLWEIVLPRLRDQVEHGKIEVEQVAVFCKAAPVTVRSWLKGDHPANGERLLRLWHILSLGGDAPEIDSLPEVNKFLSRLYAFGVIDIQEVQLYAGMDSAHVGNVYKALRGQPLMRRPIEPAELYAMYEDQLTAAIAAINPSTATTPTTNTNILEAASAPTPVAQQPPRETSEVISEPEIAPTITSVTSLLSADPKLLLASLLGASAPLAKVLLSEATTAEERSKFRELVGTEVLFELSNTLNALCSERARGLAR